MTQQLLSDEVGVARPIIVGLEKGNSLHRSNGISYCTLSYLTSEVVFYYVAEDDSF